MLKFKKLLSIIAVAIMSLLVVEGNTADAASNKTTVKMIDPNTSITAPSCNNTTNWTFYGWNTKSDGSGTWLTNYGTPASDVTFYAIYKHVHTGSSSSGGGCYQAVYHSHSDSCYTIERYEAGYSRGSSPEGWNYYHCDKCGTEFRGTNGWHNCSATSHLTCGKTGQIEGYTLGCGHSAGAYGHP